ncbi:unnamed protein product [Paramecium octaurelia]|uniref:Uncharacterized protein n=1 Tax=Paramecium octaurelia TaxID=43137 RepID=A0A8S1RYH1_PAROT|nr:unnamed protein product [Paramecium octaurelia]
MIQIKNKFLIKINPIEFFKQIKIKTKNDHYLLQILNLTLRILDACFHQDFQVKINSYIYKFGLFLYTNLINYFKQKLQNFYYLKLKKNAYYYPYRKKWLEINPKLTCPSHQQINQISEEKMNSRLKKLQSFNKNRKNDKLQQRLYLKQNLFPVEFLLQNLSDKFD